MPGEVNQNIDPIRFDQVRGLGRIKLVDLAPLARQHSFEAGRYNIGPGRGHLSAAGNRLVATLLDEQLRPLIEQARREMAVTP